MKNIYKILIVLALVGGFASCNDELEITNPNNQTTFDFGDSESELQEAIIACYNRIRLEGTFARVGYTMDAVRGDEVWNSSQQWYLEADNLNGPATFFMAEWPWRDLYHVVNRTNFVLSKVDDVDLSQDAYNQIAGQALFLRSLAYYQLTTYYQTVPLITDYASYADINTMYASNNTQDEVLDQIEADLTSAMQMLPSRDEGGEWAGGRATCGAAAGYLARTLMFRHKFEEAYSVLKDIIAGKYGTYALTADFGDNFREDTENNSESLFEVQFLDYGTGGVDEEWTPVNISSEATQGHAVESNYASQELGSWGDLAGSPWLYNLYKKENSTDGRLDPRLYWTLVTFEPEYGTYTGLKTAAYPDGDPRSNTIYQQEITKTPLSNNAQGGISIAKFTNARNNIYESITNGLHCGVNIRLMRYSDVLLRAAECENEINGPTQTAIDYINEVRRRVALEDLKLSDFPSADALFEQIANVERPKEFGCENGRGIDLLRWGFFYDADRLNQITEHAYYVLDGTANTDELTAETASASSFQYFYKGHEYFPIYQNTLNANPNLVGNSANKNEDNGPAFFEKGYTVRPVVDLD
ncbi:Starch-binding associating with outer membrane [Draconibacterium orientale]|uniref:Starch-binding associating with outer membrane n=1 Tax=Draconibacterium orientale TaxID=1168034 RepID=X5DCU8_9BACT|nr:RagB/SusD family nutrient uptake outer membrane protein [Draconibacterium orientale]AHW58774.1 starch-binding protein [Draconibacterium orientale]SET49125.1 Starch-binding associating with outer membrane [Draconibacterium orientale]